MSLHDNDACPDVSPAPRAFRLAHTARRLGGLLAVLLTVAGCTIQNAGDDDGASDDDSASDEGSVSSGGGTGGAVVGGSDSCNKVLTCIVSCPAGDDACANTCYASGSQGAQQKIDALASCLDASMCADAECAKMACAGEIGACVDDVDAPTDPAPPVTAGMVPAELVGDWLGSRGSYHFEATGSYFFVGILSSSGPCIAFEKIVLTDTGLASVTGNTLSVTAQTTQQDTHDCSGQVTTKTYAGDTSQYTWSIQGTTLTLVGDTGPIEYEKQ